MCCNVSDLTHGFSSAVSGWCQHRAGRGSSWGESPRGSPCVTQCSHQDSCAWAGAVLPWPGPANTGGKMSGLGSLVSLRISSTSGHLHCWNPWVFGKPASIKGGAVWGSGAQLPKLGWRVVPCEKQGGCYPALCTPPAREAMGRELALQSKGIFIYHKSTISQSNPLPRNLKYLRKAP